MWQTHSDLTFIDVYSCQRETREELGKAVGDAYFPLTDVPDIQKEFLRQVEEQEEKERKKKEEEKADTVDDLGKSLGEVALVQCTGQVIITFKIVVNMINLRLQLLKAERGTHFQRGTSRREV